MNTILNENDNSTEALESQPDSMLQSIQEQPYTLIDPPIEEEEGIEDIYRSRITGAPWFKEVLTKDIIIAGIGGIGSYVTFFLSRLNPKSLTIYDPDIVESSNMTGQLFSIPNINEYKVNAISSLIYNYSNYMNILAIPGNWIGGNLGGPIMICGFDNMQARKVFFQSWLKYVLSLPLEDRGSCLFIDGRLSAEDFQIICIKGNCDHSINTYNSTYLFTDQEAEVQQCSFKQTSHMAGMIGSYITSLFINFIDNRPELPFYTEFSGPNIVLNTRDN